ncbi:hypothetical protein Ciccas_005859 [Cichlidogyrus casuarinus]|uniref:C2H2-type domain-containing protein n=1 Tax=Cichlidogyrus casuarinus TaxID=1844966 RepID=A0ABD2Q8F3_9PLAT
MLFYATLALCNVMEDRRCDNGATYPVGTGNSKIDSLSEAQNVSLQLNNKSDQLNAGLLSLDRSIYDIRIGHETRAPLASMDTNGDHVKLNDEASSNACVFPVGAYVMAPWKNNFEYLAEVISHRKRFGTATEYKLRFVWDHIVEWYPHQKVRQATKFETDYVFNLCKTHGGPGCGRLLDGPADFHNGFTPKTPRSRQRQQSGASEISTSDFSVDLSGKRSAAKRRRKSESKVLSSLATDDMLYDKSMARFSEACKRRRQMKRESADMADKKRTFSSSSNHLSPHSPLSKSSVELCASVSPKSTDTPDSVDLNSVIGVYNSKNSSPVLCPSNEEPRVGVRKFPCPRCTRVLRNSKLLQAHLDNYHPNPQKDYIVLEESPRTFFADHQPKLVQETTSFLSGLLKCSGCFLRTVSHKIDPKNLHIRCETCFCWSHQACVIGGENFNCEACLRRCSADDRLGRYHNLDWVPSTPLNEEDRCKQQVFRILDTAKELEPLLYASKLHIKSLEPTTSSPPVALLPTASLKLTSTPADEKLNR